MVYRFPWARNQKFNKMTTAVTYKLQKKTTTESDYRTIVHRSQIF